MVGLAERHAEGDQKVGNICGEEEGVCHGSCAAVGPDFQAGEDLAHDLEAEVCLIQGIKDGRLIFLKVAIVGKREAFYHGVKGSDVAAEPACLAAKELAGIWVFLLGHEAGASGVGFGKLNKAKLRGGPDNEVFGDAGEVNTAEGASIGELYKEVAIGNGIEAVSGDKGVALGIDKAHGAGGKLAIDGKRSASESARAEGRAVCTQEDISKAIPIAAKHLHIGKKVVGEGNGLGALEVSVSRDVDGAGALGEIEQGSNNLCKAIMEAGAGIFEEEAHIGGHLVVTAARGMELGGSGNALGEPMLDIHVDILLLRIPLEGAFLNLCGNLIQARMDGIALGRGKDADVGEHGSVGLAALYVVGGKAFIERDGLAEAKHEGRGPFGKAAASGSRCGGARHRIKI